MVDDEVKRLLDEAYAKASVLLKEHKDLLERIAQALLERGRMCSTSTSGEKSISRDMDMPV